MEELGNKTVGMKGIRETLEDQNKTFGKEMDKDAIVTLREKITRIRRIQPRHAHSKSGPPPQNSMTTANTSKTGADHS